MGHRTNSWVFESKNKDKIYFKIIENGLFKIYYDDEDEHYILFEMKDIPDLINLLLEIQGP